MKLQIAFILLALAAVFGQTTITRPNEIESYGTGVVLVPIDRVALTVTVTGTGNNAAAGVLAANNLETQVNNTLQNFTIYDIRSGGLYLEPLYSGSSLTFAAHMSLSIVIPGSDLPRLIDELVTLGASNISFIFTPDFYAVELAQRQSLELAVTDALFKAQSILNMLHLCPGNITRIHIRNPTLELPSLTFSLFANMGRNVNVNVNGNNLSSGSAANNGSPARGSGSGTNINSNPAQPTMLGAAAPLLEGNNQEVVSYVEIAVSQLACTLAGSGAVTDLTSGLDLSNIVGISGGNLPPMSAVHSASPSASPASPGSPGVIRRGVRSTMW